MNEFAITFSETYIEEIRPVWPQAHPHGYLVVEALSWDHARFLAIERLGRTWSFIFPMNNFPDKFRYPLGELARWRV